MGWRGGRADGAPKCLVPRTPRRYSLDREGGIRVSRGAKAVKRKRAGELNSLSCQIHISRAVFLQCCVPETRKRCEKNSADEDSFTQKYLERRAVHLVTVP